MSVYSQASLIRILSSPVIKVSLNNSLGGGVGQFNSNFLICLAVA